MSNIEAIDKLIANFCRLSGVGAKTAQRYTFNIINMSEDEVAAFCSAMRDVKANVKFCPECGCFTESGICEICTKRDNSIICVVKDNKDVLAMEKVRNYTGTYHVLNGVLNPLEGIGSDDINIRQLLNRINDSTQEVIIATNPDVCGEATAMYIAKLIKPLGVKVTRLAQGVSVGSDLEYTDELTLSRALNNRQEI